MSGASSTVTETQAVSWLMVANLPMNRGHKRARRVALKIYRWQRKQYYRPLIHKGKAPRN